MAIWFLIIVTASIAALLNALLSISKPKPNLPPGPRPIPILSTVLWLGKSSTEIRHFLKTLGSKFGPIVTLHIGSRPVIFVSNRDLAHQALIQQGAVFADRPESPATSKIMSNRVKKDHLNIGSRLTVDLESEYSSDGEEMTSESWATKGEINKEIDLFTTNSNLLDLRGVTLLKRYKLMLSNGHMSGTQLESFKSLSGDDSQRVMIQQDDTLKLISKGEGSGNKRSSEVPKQLSSNDKDEVGEGREDKEKKISLNDFNDTKISNIDEIRKCINKESFKIDHEKLKIQLEKFIKTVNLEDEAYMSGDIVIKHFKDSKNDIQLLVAAGTKILDAVVFLAMNNVEGMSDLFTEKQVDGLPEKTLMVNVRKAKRAIQAALVLVYTQGSLPLNKGSDERNVPKFIIEKLYDGDKVKMSQIGEELSATSTRKFPAKIFLRLDINMLPPTVASRCKLNVAGNRAVRYATFAAGFDQNQDVESPENQTKEVYLKIIAYNNKLGNARKICEVLRSLEGNHLKQLRMHPLAVDKPSAQKLTMKLTCAIIFCLSKAGRMEMVTKIKADNNMAFQRDTNIFGVETDGERSWPILENKEADFSGLTPEGVKGIYGI